MAPTPRLTTASALVLQAIVQGYQYGFDIMDITGLPSGTVYPALRRLEEARYIRSKWEKESIAKEEQRPTRRYYEIARAGAEVLGEALKKHRLLERILPLIPRKPRVSRA